MLAMFNFLACDNHLHVHPLPTNETANCSNAARMNDKKARPPSTDRGISVASFEKNTTPGLKKCWSTLCFMQGFFCPPVANSTAADLVSSPIFSVDKTKL
jgi:hypothetical protein